MHFIFVATFGAIVDNNRLITSKIMNNRVWYVHDTNLVTFSCYAINLGIMTCATATKRIYATRYVLRIIY